MISLTLTTLTLTNLTVFDYPNVMPRRHVHANKSGFFSVVDFCIYAMQTFMTKKSLRRSVYLLGIYPILLMGYRPVCKLLIDGNYIEVGARPSYLSLSLALSKKLIAAVGAN